MPAHFRRCTRPRYWPHCRRRQRYSQSRRVCRRRHRARLERYPSAPPHSTRYHRRHCRIGHYALCVGSTTSRQRSRLTHRRSFLQPGLAPCRACTTRTHSCSRAWIRNRKHAHEIWHRPKIGAQHDFHESHDQTRACQRQPHGRHAALQRKTRWPRRQNGSCRIKHWTRNSATMAPRSRLCAQGSRSLSKATQQWAHLIQMA